MGPYKFQEVFKHSKPFATDVLIKLSAVKFKETITLSGDFKIIFVFGNPYDILISLFRRNYCSATTKKYNFGFPETKVMKEKHKELTGLSLQEYLEKGKELTGIEEYFNSYKDAKVDYPILMIRYESMWSNLDKIFDFLNISKDLVNEFPREKQRQSDWRELPDHLKDKLVSRYGNFYKRIEDFPDIKLVDPVI